jgi:tetratricopeptide (TPR) repeat protein
VIAIKQKSFTKKLFACLKIDPGYTDAHTHLGNVHKSRGEIEKAIEYFREGLESVDKEEYASDLYKNLAVLYVQEDKPDKALEVYSEAIDVNVSYATIYTDILEELNRKQLDNKVEKLCHLAFGVDSDRPYYYKNIGKQFQRLEKYDEAIKSYRKALSLDRKNQNTYESIAHIYIEQKKAKEVIDIFKEAIEVDPTYARIYTWLDRELEKNKMDDTLLKLTEIAVSVSIEDSSYYEDIGNYFYDTKKYGEAIRAYKKSLAIKESLKDSEYVTQRRRQLYGEVVRAYVKNNQPKGIIDTFKEVIDGDPKYISIYYDEANLYLNRNEMDDTLLKLTEIAAGISIEDGSYYALIGDVFFVNDRDDDAMKNFDRALTIDEKDKKIGKFQYVGMAEAYITLMKPEKAIEIFKKAIAAAKPDDYHYIYNEISRKLKTYKFYDILERLLIVASKLEVKDADYYARLGYDYARIDKHEKGFNNYEKAIKIDPGNISYRISRSMLEILNQDLDSCYITIKEILQSKKLSPENDFSARFIYILVLLLQEKNSTASIEIRNFIEHYTSQPTAYFDFATLPEDRLSFRLKSYLKRVKKLENRDRELLLKMIEVIDYQLKEKKAETIADLTNLVDERFGPLKNKKREE